MLEFMGDVWVYIDIGVGVKLVGPLNPPPWEKHTYLTTTRCAKQVFHYLLLCLRVEDLRTWG